MQPPSVSLQPLAIVGASVRAAAASAVQAGFRPLAADLFADADLRAIATTTRITPYPEGLLDWMRAVEPAAWMYTGALENHPELVDQMGWLAPLWGNPGDVLQRVRSPWNLTAVLRTAGLLFPETRDSAEGLPQDGSWLAKTYRGASGSGVREWSQSGRGGEWERGRLASVEITSKSPPLPLSSSPPLCYQRRIAGTPCAAVFVANQGSAALFGITRQLVGETWLGAHGFQYAGSIGPWPVSDAALATIRQIGQVILEQFELLGLFGVDMIVDGDKVWTIEVNPRYTASVEIIERFSGSRALAAHAAACAEGRETKDLGISSEATEPPVPSRHPPAHGKAILFAKCDVLVSKKFAERALAEALAKPWPTLADIPTTGTLIEAGRPILTVFAAGQSEEEVERRLRERVAQIEMDVYAGEASGK